MPQLEQISTYASQIFWLVVVFAVLLGVMLKVALPRVQGILEERQKRIDDDLARRDFSINAMAVGLTPSSWGTLMDPFGGREDAAGAVVRVLHSDSFADDPTRILRAVRYSRRLGFELDAETEALLRRDLRIVEERLQGQMHQLEIRLMRWTIATLLAGMGIAAAIAAAIVQVVG